MGIVSFSPIQEGTGDPSPTNVRPIKPGLVLKSKNLCNESFLSQIENYSVSGPYGYFYTEPIFLKPNTTYKFSFTSVPTYETARYWIVKIYTNEYEDILADGDVKYLINGTYKIDWIITTGTSGAIRFAVNGGQDTLDEIWDRTNVQLEEGSVATEYEPYYNIEIYGGYVDFNNSEVVNNTTLLTFDGSSDEQWVTENLTSGNSFYMWKTNISPTPRDTPQYSSESSRYPSNIKCNQAKTFKSGEEGYSPGLFYFSSAALNVHLGTTLGLNNVAEFKTYLSSHNLQIAYELETPITYSLTASQLTQAYNQLVPISPVMLARRRRIMMQRNPNILYEAWNLSFNGVDEYIDTGVYLFTQENINRDFEFIAEGIAGEGSQKNNTIICAKHNGNSYGFLVRIENSNKIEYNGTIYIWPSPGSIVLRRINGVITLNGTNIKNPRIKFTNDVFDWSLVLGCAIDDNGKPYRFRKGTIDHVCVRWL